MMCQAVSKWTSISKPQIPGAECRTCSSATRCRPRCRCCRPVWMGTWLSASGSWSPGSTRTRGTAGAGPGFTSPRPGGTWRSAVYCTSSARICWPPTRRATRHCTCVGMWTPSSSLCPTDSRLTSGQWLFILHSESPYSDTIALTCCSKVHYQSKSSTRLHIFTLVMSSKADMFNIKVPLCTISTIAHDIAYNYVILSI